MVLARNSEIAFAAAVAQGVEETSRVIVGGHMIPFATNDQHRNLDRRAVEQRLPPPRGGDIG